MEEKCKALCEIGSVKSRDQTGEDIHRVMGGQYQDGKCFEEYDSDGTNGEPTHPETGEFDGAQDCDGGMPGKEVIIGHAVGTSRDGKPGWCQIASGGGGRATQACMIWRKPSTMTSP